jgi:hypothetical protein
MIINRKYLMTQQPGINRQLWASVSLVFSLLLFFPAPSSAASESKSQPQLLSAERTSPEVPGLRPHQLAFQPAGYRPSYGHIAYDYYPYVNPPYGRYPYYGPWPASDQDMRRNVRNELLNDGLLDPSNIRVIVSGHVVTLSGSVRFLAEYYRAWQDAYAAGAPRVLNQLRVRYH